MNAAVDNEVQALRRIANAWNHEEVDSGDFCLYSWGLSIANPPSVGGGSHLACLQVNFGVILDRETATLRAAKLKAQIWALHPTAEQQRRLVLHPDSQPYYAYVETIDNRREGEMWIQAEPLK